MARTAAIRIVFPDPDGVNSLPDLAVGRRFREHFDRCLARLKPVLDETGFSVVGQLEQLLRVDVEGPQEALQRTIGMIRKDRLGEVKEVPGPAIFRAASRR
jgi:hypothetical protein